MGAACSHKASTLSFMKARQLLLAGFSMSIGSIGAAPKPTCRVIPLKIRWRDNQSGAQKSDQRYLVVMIGSAVKTLTI